MSKSQTALNTAAIARVEGKLDTFIAEFRQALASQGTPAIPAAPEVEVAPATPAKAGKTRLCKETTADGDRCKVNAVKGERICGLHKRAKALKSAPATEPKAGKAKAEGEAKPAKVVATHPCEVCGNGALIHNTVCRGCKAKAAKALEAAAAAPVTTGKGKGKSGKK